YQGNSEGGDLKAALKRQNQRVCEQIREKNILKNRLEKSQSQYQLAYDFKPMTRESYRHDRRRLQYSWGLWGVYLQTEKGGRWFWPSDFLENNIRFQVLFEKICGKGTNPSQCLEKWKGKIYTFETVDFLSIPTPPYFRNIYRLAPLIPIQEVNRKELLVRLKLMRDWYLNNMEPSGKMTYLYRSNVDRKSRTHNNMIRQFMTTLALFRLGNYLQDPALLQAAEKNLEYNLNTFMKVEEDKKIAYIYFRKKAKLGAAAFALMSVLESKSHPQREKLISYFLNFIIGLQQPNGSFKTFYLPVARNDNHNFYPGEAMLALMTLYETNTKKYSHIPEVIRRAFGHYRKFFRNKPNPAFVPWQTMALYRYYQLKKDPEVAKFILEMNDFLIEIQNTPKSVKTPEKDSMGRFFDPKKRQYGPPHASSTAIYSEGLVDAYRLAQDLKDSQRSQDYAYAIKWGLRSLLQLQYTLDNTYYLPNKRATVGALHTTVTNGNTRVDNTQHSTMAILNFFSLPDQGASILGTQSD
ncbi:MAG: hypothetical protein R3257_00235, partial [bacterium]|nr:hypothetical protein [bacterium]